MRPLALLLLAACGRIDFAPIGGDGGRDGGAGGDGAGPPPPCRTGMIELPASSYPSIVVARLPSGWAVLGRKQSVAEIEMRIVDDDLNASAPVTVISTGAPSIVTAAAWLGDSLTVLWTTTSPVDRLHGRFRLDATMIDQASMRQPAAGITSARLQGGELVISQFSAGLPMYVSTIDAAGAEPPPLVATSTPDISWDAAHGAGGYAALWGMSGAPPSLHLTGIDSAGTPIVADRALGVGGANVIWIGDRYVVQWNAQSGPAQFATLDSAFNPLAGPLDVDPATNSTVADIAWNGAEVAFARPDLMVGDVSLVRLDQSGAPTAPIVTFGDGTTTQVSGPKIAAGPDRFALIWTIGTFTVTRFAVQCR